MGLWEAKVEKRPKRGEKQQKKGGVGQCETFV
jgi:hypothetical protein